MLNKFVRIFGGDPNKREIERLAQVVAQINALESKFEALSDEALRAKTAEFRQRLAEGETLDDLLPEAFAAVREASKRTIGLRHFDVQLIGGITLHSGKIAEMRTGEGKTLVATLPLYLNALTGKGVHLVTVNDYLARRDARWMGPIYDLLGMSVGVLQMAARTENAKKAFLVDLERSSPHEDQHQLRMVPRHEAYLADITYGTNSEFGFDYLRDNMAMRLEDRVQRGHHYAIVDEVDNVLIDEARTPLIISGPAQDEAEWYIKTTQVVKALRPEDYEVNEKDRSVSLTEIGEMHVEELLGVPLRDPERPEDITPEQARLLGYLEQALRARFLFHRNKDYIVQAGKVIIVDEFTGRLMPGRRWSDGLHQAIEAKEGVRVQSESVTYATITIQNYFRMYEKLAGMSGTALTEAEEFDKIYKLGVLAIPTNLEYIASQPDSELEELEARDEDGYKYQYYARKEDPLKQPVYWKRKDYPDVVYRTEDAKLRAIAREILRDHALGRPVLVGTTSVEMSERVSARLRAEPLRRLALTLLLRDAWLNQHDYVEDGRQIAELQFLNAALDKIDPAEMRKLARELGIPSSPEDPKNLDRLAELLNLPEENKKRLLSDLQGGIQHQVLNARKHTEESQIIAGAGAFGAVTIATNMAGRGVDIKLGGELTEQITAAVARVLSRAGYKKPYDMSLQERRQALLELDPSAYGIYEAEIQYFLNYMKEMELVRALGGLHVIGSERHEARRIDNQLRGRSARQGDPGSSRFYLSMEDELMRLFGGAQADALMQRMKIDDSLPLEMNLVGRLVEQAQTRVEGANFDTRKHLLEYDDVLNAQRARIYAQRDRIFTKDDLKEDVTDMLRTELLRRIPEALKDEGGPWKLLAWLEQVQPPLDIGEMVFPSYTLRLVLAHLKDQLNSPDKPEPIRDALLEVARQSLIAEREHQLKSIRNLLEAAQDHLEEQVRERLETLDTFFEGLSLEEDGEKRKPAELVADLTNSVRLPIKLSPEEQRLLRDNPKALSPRLSEQVETLIFQQALTRLKGAVERRLEETIELSVNPSSDGSWEAISQQVLGAVEALYANRAQRYLGGNGSEGQIVKDLEAALLRLPLPLDEQKLLQLLLLLPQGARAAFDKRTHRRTLLRTTRLTYTFFAARFLEGRDSEQVAAEVLEHLERAQEVMCRAWGVVELNRLANMRLADLDDAAQQSILNAFADRDTELLALPLKDLPQEAKFTTVNELGRRTLTEIYRQLLLGVIGELWVDYLTQMEGLRVSIGLEAYAQRDPLVQYKNRASELFQELLSNVRLGVVTRMFTFRPRDLSRAQTSAARSEVAETQPVEIPEETRPTPPPQPEGARASSPTAQPAASAGGKKKRKRHR